MQRKKSFLTILTTLLIVGFGISAIAADYPTKPLQLLIPFGAGGSADSMGRLIAKAAEPSLGQPVVAVNKPGAGGGIMYTTLINAKPDGYTIGWNSTGILTVTNIGNVPFKYDAFIDVCRIGYSSLPIAVKTDAPWKTIQEFIDHVRKNPGTLKLGTAGTGSATHLVPVVMETRMGLKMIHVPLGAERRIPSLLGGEVEAICVPLPEIAAQVLAGKARALVLPSAERDPAFPDVPTMKEMGQDIVIDLYRGISVPKGTPAPVVAKLEAAFKAASRDKAFNEFSKKNGFNVSYMGQAEFNKYIKPMNDMIAKVMEEAGLKKK